jgi:hypothetical protein
MGEAVAFILGVIVTLAIVWIGDIRNKKEDDGKINI